MTNNDWGVNPNWIGAFLVSQINDKRKISYNLGKFARSDANEW